MAKRTKEKSGARIIAHLDMDAFFASVEERYTPRFRGLPIAVGSEPKDGKGRGVVSTANYKAREYGIHSALPVTKAWQISQEMKAQGKPEVIFLPVDFELYNKSSANIFKIIQKHSPLVEPASIDEFYFDLSFVGSFKKAEGICKKIKKDIREEEKITCSIGIGPNKLISKIAAGFKKPDGLFIVPGSRISAPNHAKRGLVSAKRAEISLPGVRHYGSIESFLDPLPIRKIPGIGPKTEELLQKLNVKIVKDIKKFSKEELKNILGKWGEDLYLKSRGIDDSQIVIDREVKSIGEQTTFENDTLSALFIGDALFKMCEGVFKSFIASGFERCKTIAITVRFTGFETKTSAKTIKDGLGADDLNKFKTEALKLILPYLDKRKNPQLKPIRLIGVRMEKFGDNLPKTRQGKLKI